MAETPSEASGDAETGRLRSAWIVPPWLDRTAGWAWRFMIIAIGVIGLAWILDRLQLVVLSLLVALLLSTLGSPMVSWLVDRRIPRLVASWLALVVVIAVVSAIGSLIALTVRQEIGDGERWDEVEIEVKDWLRDGPLGLSDEDIDDLEQRLRDAFRGGVGTVDSEQVRFVIEILGASFLSAVLFFFFVKDGPAMWLWVLGHVRTQRRETVDVAGRAAFRALGAYVRGVALTGVIDAVAIGLALWIIGVPLVLPLAIITFFAAFFPIVGATTAGALAALVALVANGPGDAFIVALVALAVQQLEGDLIMPVVMRHQVHLHPVVVLVALATGGALSGISGAFVAVPVAAMIGAAAGAIRRLAIEEETRGDPPLAGGGGDG